jgi:hypothetical protein
MVLESKGPNLKKKKIMTKIYGSNRKSSHAISTGLNAHIHRQAESILLNLKRIKKDNVKKTVEGVMGGLLTGDGSGCEGGKGFGCEGGKGLGKVGERGGGGGGLVGCAKEETIGGGREGGDGFCAKKLVGETQINVENFWGGVSDVVSETEPRVPEVIIGIEDAGEENLIEDMASF